MEFKKKKMKINNEIYFMRALFKIFKNKNNIKRS